MACAALLPSEKRAYYLKYISLLNDGGKLVLLEKLRHSVPNNDIVAQLKRQRPKVAALRNKHIISDSEYDLLYPQTGTTDTSTFDLTLLTFLLRSICGLNTKSAVWDTRTPPADADMSVEADVVRLRNWRNKMIGHAEKTELSRQEFEGLWESTEKVLLRLGHNILNLKSVISASKSQSIDPLREIQLENEISIWKQKYNILDDDLKNVKHFIEDLNTSNTVCENRLIQVESNQTCILQMQDELTQTQQKLHQNQSDNNQTQKLLLQKRADCTYIQTQMQLKLNTLQQTQTHMQEVQFYSTDICYKERQKIEHRLSGVERKLDQCQETLADKKTDHGRFRNEQAPPSEHRDDFHIEEKKQAVPETTTKDLKRRLLEIYKDNFQQVPIYLPKPTWKLPVKELYVNPELIVVDNRGKRLIENTFNQRSNAQSINIEGVRDIFYTDGNLCKNIYISGEPGTGKSTFCEHLVQLWCDAHDATEKTKLDEDEKTMLEFKLLFYINLRDVTVIPEYRGCDELAKIIHEQLELYSYFSISDLYGCLTDPSTLVLMDSLDEIKSERLPYRGLHMKSCIVTTSRPWKLDVMRSQLEGKVDKQIEIVGLTQKSTTKLADNIVNILNKTLGKENNPDDFIQKVLHERLQQLMSIPILVLQMLSLWYDGESFGNSQYEVYSKMIHHQILAAIKAKSLPSYEGTCKMPFPSCYDIEKCPCRNFAKLLWKVANLAYHTIFCDIREASLVFDDAVTELHGLDSVDLETCFKIGILTQHRAYTNKLTEDKTVLSFFHKTNQEYFASNLLCSMALGDVGQGTRYTSSTAVNKLKTFCKRKFSSYKEYLSNPQVVFEAITNLNRALELNKIILFYCQMDSGAARVISRIISEKADNDERVQSYREGSEWDHDCLAKHNFGLIREIQRIILKAIQPNTKLFLSDILIDRDIRERKLDIRGVDMSLVKSVVIQTRLDKKTWKKLKECKGLQIFASYDSEPMLSDIREILLRNKTTLRTLDVQNKLISLNLFKRDCCLKGQRRSNDISVIGESITELLIMNQLTTLSIYHVQLSHMQCQTLCRQLSKAQSTDLDCLKCAKHGYMCVFESLCDVKFSSCSLNLFHSPQLEASWEGGHQQIGRIKAHVDSEDDVSRCLQKLSNNAGFIKYLSLYGLPIKAVKDVLILLQNLNVIEEMCLSRIDFGDKTQVCVREILLRNIQTLKALCVDDESLKVMLNGSVLDIQGLRDTEFDLLLLGHDITSRLNLNNLTALNIAYVKLSHMQCQNLVQHISIMHNPESVNFSYLRCTDHGYECIFVSVCDGTFSNCSLSLSPGRLEAIWRGEQQQEGRIIVPPESGGYISRHLLQALLDT